MGELDQLKQEMVVDLLREWVTVYDRAETIYDAYDDETRAWVGEHGHRVESLVTVVAMMQPAVRVVCRAMVEDALAQLSQDPPTIEHTVGRATAQAKSSEGEMGGERDLEAEVEELRREIAELRRLLEHHLETCPGAESAPEGQRPQTEGS